MMGLVFVGIARSVVVCRAGQVAALRSAQHNGHAPKITGLRAMILDTLEVQAVPCS